MSTIESTTPSGDDGVIVARPGRVAPGSVLGLALWAVIVLIGFAVILTLGSPLPDDRSVLERALNPTPPVSQAQALESADVIVRHQYPEFAGGARSVIHLTDHNDERYTITYAFPRQAQGVRITVSVKGNVSVATYP
jgi:hypothetical protein